MYVSSLERLSITAGGREPGIRSERRGRHATKKEERQEKTRSFQGRDTAVPLFASDTVILFVGVTCALSCAHACLPVLACLRSHEKRGNSWIDVLSRSRSLRSKREQESQGERERCIAIFHWIVNPRRFFPLYASLLTKSAASLPLLLPHSATAV